MSVPLMVNSVNRKMLALSRKWTPCTFDNSFRCRSISDIGEANYVLLLLPYYTDIRTIYPSYQTDSRPLYRSFQTSIRPIYQTYLIAIRPSYRSFQTDVWPFSWYNNCWPPLLCHNLAIIFLVQIVGYDWFNGLTSGWNHHYNLY